MDSQLTRAELQREETALIGEWQLINGIMCQDTTCDRIHWLTTKVLKMICVDGNSWSALYRDMNDGRFWELTYPKSHMHGGGPPSLCYITDSDVMRRWRLNNLG